MTDQPKVNQTPETYDNLYTSGGYAGTYHQPYRESLYYPMFKEVRKHCRELGATKILEVGCGNGAFAEMLFDSGHEHYVGFDFSKKAIALAQTRCSERGLFLVADALSKDAYQHEYDTIVCTEVLEHIPDDRSIVRNWAPACKFVCTVPSFDSKYHERFFRDDSEVRARYEGLLDIHRMSVVMHPGAPQRGAKARLKKLAARAAGLLPGRPLVRPRWYVFSGTVK